MYVTLLSAPDDGDGEFVAHPSLGDVELAVRALDGRHRTLVVLGTHGAAHMAIGGGPHRFIVTATRDGDRYAVALDPPAPEGTVRLPMEGDGDEFAMRETVELPAALWAARTFTFDGRLDRRLIWGKR